MTVCVLELFSGTASVGKCATQRGFEVISVDVSDKHSPTHCVDIMTWDYKSCKTPDFLWASPPCTTYSIAATWKRHRCPKTGTAWSREAKAGDRILRRTMTIAKWFLKKNPALKICVENPRGYMRLRSEVQWLTCNTTSYNNFDYPVCKPTNLWTNFELTLPPPQYKVKNKCHIGVGNWRRVFCDDTGATGTTASILGMIPPSLVNTILDQALGSSEAHP